jgi:hypothetical protein
MDLFKSIPLEVYKDTLYLLTPTDIINICHANKYAAVACDDNFYRTYVQKHFDPVDYGFTFWTKDILTLTNTTTWKDLFNIFVDGRSIVYNTYDSVNDEAIILNKSINIKFTDTLLDIWEKCKHIFKVNKHLISEYSDNIELSKYSKYLGLKEILIVDHRGETIYALHMSKNPDELSYDYEYGVLDLQGDEIWPPCCFYFDEKITYLSYDKIGLVSNNYFYFNIDEIWLYFH